VEFQSGAFMHFGLFLWGLLMRSEDALCVFCWVRGRFLSIFNSQNQDITDFQEEKSPQSRFTTAPELGPPFKIDQNAVPPAKNS